MMQTHGSTMSAVRASLLAASLVLALGACKRAGEAPAEGGASPAAPSSAAAGSSPEAPPATNGNEKASAFNVADLPVSQATIGSFPYLGLPQGYASQDVVDSEFDRVPFWTGDRVEWIEGKIHSSVLQSSGDHPYSQLELSRNVQSLVEALGGKRIFSGTIPADASRDIGNSKAATTYVGGIGDIYNEPAETYVIHREDRDIWIHLGSGGNAGGLLVAETKPMQITAKVIEADSLKQALDSSGKVSIQVNFATDAAEILPNSEPQIAQVTQLLQADPKLRLSVEGHTDNSGSQSHNQTLSQARAESVRNRLVGSGIAADRLGAKGFGQSQPVADNTTEEGRRANRRVELVKR